MDKKQVVKLLEQYKAYRLANHPLADMIDSALATLIVVAAEMNMSDRAVRRRKASALEKLNIALKGDHRGIPQPK